MFKLVQRLLAKQTVQRRSRPIRHRSIGLLLGLLTGVFTALPAWSAERLTTYVGPLQLSVPIDELETFAKEGRATGSLRLLLSVMSPQQKAMFQQVLKTPIQQNSVALSRVTSIPMIEQVLISVGNTIQTDSALNGFHALRSALILAAAKTPDGWTAVDVMREYPTSDIRINLRSLLGATQGLATVLNFQQAAAEVVVQQASQEAQAAPQMNYAALPDLSQPGTFTVEKTQLNFEVKAVRSTLQGFSGNYTLVVDVYMPKGATGPVPLAVSSHGWGGRLSDGEYIARHLASYGFAVAVPKHIGTTDSYRSVFLAGALGDITSPIEFISRQNDIIFMLDELEKLQERDRNWQGRIDLQRVGVIGQSLGGQTVLSSAGATFNTSTFSPLCQSGLVQFNPSFLLQCQARFLPPTTFNFSDPRIKAGIAQYPMGSTMFGPEGLANVDIPILMLAGSEDVLAPSVYEQLPMFSWLEKAPRYLAFFLGGNHFSTSPEGNISMIPAPLRGPDAAIGRRYIKTLSVAFLKTYLSDSPETSPYRPYLTAAYGKAISDPAMPLYLLTSLTPEQLAVAYGGIAPGRDRLNAAAVAERPESVLEDIRQSGTLRVGIRTDAAPFGFINSESIWTGYCFDMANGLANFVSARIDQPVQTVFLPSTLSDRFELVRNDTIHLECGPNTIRTDVEGIKFSTPFFVAGSKMVVQSQNADRINPNGNLAGIRIGVLNDTTTEQFVRNRYPSAAIVPFTGVGAFQDALAGVTAGTLDAFVNDDILLLGELAQSEIPSTAVQLIPEKPLTCDFYGLVLPGNDPEWISTVNSFNRSEPSRKLQSDWFDRFSPNALSTLTQCEQ